MVEAYRGKLLEAGAGRRTVNKALTLLGSVFRYAEKHGWMAANPARFVSKLRDDTGEHDAPVEDNILRPHEIPALLAAAKPGRDHALLMTAVMTGMRSSELIGLQWGDIDWKSNQVSVRRCFRDGRFYEPKSKYSRRRIDVPEQLISELKRWRLQCPKGQDLTFPNTLGRPENNANVLHRVFHPALRRAGLRKVRFHDLWHTYASLLIAGGEHPKYIQMQMGHSSIKVTMDTYGHLMQATNAQAAEKLAALALGSTTGSEHVAKR